MPHPIEIDEDEMYGEFFDIPAPDELVFLSTGAGVMGSTRSEGPQALPYV